MRRKNKLILDQLDRKLYPFKVLEKTTTPERGWIYTIRKSLNMTLEQLGNRINMTRQGVKKLEDREVQGTVSINTLKEIGKAMDLKLIYGFAPIHESIDHLVSDKANKLATKIVMRTHQNMQLENQGTSEQQIKNAIEELADEIKREMRKSLWD